MIPRVPFNMITNMNSGRHDSSNESIYKINDIALIGGYSTRLNKREKDTYRNNHNKGNHQ